MLGFLFFLFLKNSGCMEFPWHHLDALQENKCDFHLVYQVRGALFPGCQEILLCFCCKPGSFSSRTVVTEALAGAG